MKNNKELERIRVLNQISLIWFVNYKISKELRWHQEKRLFAMFYDMNLKNQKTRS